MHEIDAFVPFWSDRFAVDADCFRSRMLTQLIPCCIIYLASSNYSTPTRTSLHHLITMHSYPASPSMLHVQLRGSIVSHHPRPRHSPSLGTIAIQILDLKILKFSFVKSLKSILLSALK